MKKLRNNGNEMTKTVIIKIIIIITMRMRIKIGNRIKI